MTAGQPVGRGLTKQAAEELGLIEGTPVGSAVIDAYVYLPVPPVFAKSYFFAWYSYAGWIGTVAARYSAKEASSPDALSPIPTLDSSGERLAAVAGTSTCHVIQVCSLARRIVQQIDGAEGHRVRKGYSFRVFGDRTR